MLYGQARARVFRRRSRRLFFFPLFRKAERWCATRNDDYSFASAHGRPEACPIVLRKSLPVCMPKQTNGAGTRKSRPRLSETTVVTYQMPPAAVPAAERTSAEASSTSCGTVSTRTNCCTSPAAWLAVHVIALPDRLPIS